MQIIYEYLENRSDWLQVKLKMDPKINTKRGVLHKMFYIGNSEYDQVDVKSEIHVEKVRKQTVMICRCYRGHGSLNGLHSSTCHWG